MPRRASVVVVVRCSVGSARFQTRTPGWETFPLWVCEETPLFPNRKDSARFALPTRFLKYRSYHILHLCSSTLHRMHTLSQSRSSLPSSALFLRMSFLRRVPTCRRTSPTGRTIGWEVASSVFEGSCAADHWTCQAEWQSEKGARMRRDNVLSEGKTTPWGWAGLLCRTTLLALPSEALRLRSWRRFTTLRASLLPQSLLTLHYTSRLLR